MDGEGERSGRVVRWGCFAELQPAESFLKAKEAFCNNTSRRVTVWSLKANLEGLGLDLKVVRKTNIGLIFLN